MRHAFFSITTLLLASCALVKGDVTYTLDIAGANLASVPQMASSGYLDASGNLIASVSLPDYLTRDGVTFTPADALYLPPGTTGVMVNSGPGMGHLGAQISQLGVQGVAFGFLLSDDTFYAALEVQPTWTPPTFPIFAVGFPVADYEAPGTYYDGNGDVLTVVDPNGAPEPSAYWLSALGLAGLFTYLHARKRAKAGA